MNKYTVSGTYTISFTTSVVAETEEDAESKALCIDFWESANGGIFADSSESYQCDVELSADGCVENVEVELEEENVEVEDE